MGQEVGGGIGGAEADVQGWRPGSGVWILS